MKVTLKQIWNAQHTINQFLQYDMKSSTAFKVSKIAKKMKEEMQIADERRLKLVEKYKINDDPSEENQEYFQSEMETLFNTEVELGVDPIRFDELEKADGSQLDIKPSILFEIDWMIENTDN